VASHDLLIFLMAGPNGCSYGSRRLVLEAPRPSVFAQRTSLEALNLGIHPALAC